MTEKGRIACDLQRCFLCRNSLPGWIQAIAANKKNIRFRKGQLIVEEGQPVNGIYFMYEGIVKVHKKWGAERELIIHFAKTGDIVGYRGLSDEKKFPVSVTALEAVTMCFVELDFFETTLGVNHQLTYQLMKLYANELLEAEERMRNLALMDVKGRLCDTLLTLQKRFGKTKAGYINLLISRQDMASYTGTTYETLFRTMALLEKEKLIHVNGKKISILKPAKLMQ
ncbi:MAG: Crp/Fnr family transcriptional regulator, partial [Chitinophagaceae bacterium]